MALADAPAAPQPQREQGYEWGPTAEILAILAVERDGKMLGLRRIGIGLAAGGAAPALASPDHIGALGGEPVSVPEHPAGQHAAGATHAEERYARRTPCADDGGGEHV